MLAWGTADAMCSVDHNQLLQTGSDQVTLTYGYAIKYTGHLGTGPSALTLTAAGVTDSQPMTLQIEFQGGLCPLSQ